MVRLFVLALACFIILQGCGNSSGKDVTSQTGKSLSQNEINALWQGSCTQTPTGGMSLYTIEFSDGKFIETTKLYADSRCTLPASAWENSGTFKLSPSTGTIPGARNIDFLVTAAAYTVFDERSQKKANGLETCGTSDWSQGEKRVCPQTQKTIYQSYLLAGSMLSLGVLDKTRDGSAPDKRPESVSNQGMTKK